MHPLLRLMIAWLLICVAAASLFWLVGSVFGEEFVIMPAMKIQKKTQLKQEDPDQRTTPRPGDHKHTCERCRISWYHGATPLKDWWTAHSCPKCGVLTPEIDDDCPT